MIAAGSFAVLVVLALAYVLAPLIIPRQDEASVCRECGAGLGEGMNYCAGCGRAVESTGLP